jgi:hypothetical protein
MVVQPGGELVLRGANKLEGGEIDPSPISENSSLCTKL